MLREYIAVDLGIGYLTDLNIDTQVVLPHLLQNFCDLLVGLSISGGKLNRNLGRIADAHLGHSFLQIFLRLGQITIDRVAVGLELFTVGCVDTVNSRHYRVAPCGVCTAVRQHVVGLTINRVVQCQTEVRIAYILCLAVYIYPVKGASHVLVILIIIVRNLCGRNCYIIQFSGLIHCQLSIAGLDNTHLNAIEVDAVGIPVILVLLEYVLTI